MKHVALSSGAITLALFAVACATPAHAGGGGFYNSNHLDDGSHIYTSRPEYQLVDDGPVLKDCRQAKKTKTYKLNFPAAPVDENEVVEIGAPGAGGSARAQNSSGASWQRSGLPSAGFESNVPRGGSSIGGNLPSGTSSNSGLSGRLAHITPPAVASRGPSPRPGAIRGPVVTMSYPSGTGASLTGGTYAEPKLRGELLHQNK